MFAFLLHWIGLTRARHCCRDCETPKFQLGHFFICVPLSKMSWLRLCDSKHRSLKSPWTNLMKYLCFSVKELDASSPTFSICVWSVSIPGDCTIPRTKTLDSTPNPTYIWKNMPPYVPFSMVSVPDRPFLWRARPQMQISDSTRATNKTQRPCSGT